MKILFVIPTLGTGGAERVATILANSFAKDNTVEFFVMEQSTVERYPIDTRIKINEIGIEVKRGNKARAVLNFGVNYIKQRNALIRKIKTYQPNIMISFLPKADMLAFSVERSNKFRWISSERNDPMSRSALERWILNHIYTKTDTLVCQTNKVADFYRSKGVRHTIVIKNPLVLKEQEKTELNINYKYFISVGRLDKQKNYEMLIQAFSMAKKETNCLEKLLILGDGPDKERLQNIIDGLHMTSNILLVGRKNNVFDYLKNAEAFVMSSNYEGLPNALIEAMAMGLPVISTDFFTGAAAELIDEHNGYLVPVGDTKKMTEAIKQMLNCSCSTRERMGKTSNKKVAEMSIEKISREWTELIARA